MPSRLDALRARLAAAQAAPFPLVPNAEYTACAAAAFDALPALLAVVEAAQDCVDDNLVDHYFVCPVTNADNEQQAKARGLVCDCPRAALDTALAALTTEEE